MSNTTDDKNETGNVVLHVSGSISCYKACELASLLVQRHYNVQVTASAGALHFIQAAVFEGLTHRPLLTDVFAGRPDFIPHITLAQKWADVIIAYPASADCITRLAAGLSDDLFGAVCLANNYAKPLLIAPAMNCSMFAHPAVQEALEKLASWGTIVLPAGEGYLACGATGQGKLIPPERAADYITQAFTREK